MKYFNVVIIIILSLAGCRRNEPDTNAPVNPPSAKGFQLLQVFNLGSPIVEPSGLVYNSKKNCLLVVSDERTDIFEIDFEGRVTGTIPTDGDDLEGITLSPGCDTIYVTEETRQLVTAYRYNGQKLFSFPVNVAANPAHALEGITIDSNGDLFVLNERDPGMIVQFRNNTETGRRLIENLLDISDIFYDKTDDSFWIVSDESASLIKTTKAGALTGQWNLSFDKGEGVAIVNDRIYIVRDSDSKMYVYSKP